MQRLPRDPKTPILTRSLVLRTLYVGVLLVMGVFGLFVYEKNSGATLEQARTAAVNVLVFGELFYLFSCRSLTRSMFALGVFSNKWILFGVSGMIILQTSFTYLPVMNRFFHSAPIDAYSWLRVLTVGLLVYISVSIEKKIRLAQNLARFQETIN